MAKKNDEAGANQPTLMAGRSLARIDLDDLIEILAFIRDHGDEDKLLKLSRHRNLTVAIPPKTVNYVKQLVAESPKMRQHPFGRKILHPVVPNATLEGRAMASATGEPDPYNSCCGFRPRG